MHISLAICVIASIRTQIEEETTPLCRRNSMYTIACNFADWFYILFFHCIALAFGREIQHRFFQIISTPIFDPVMKWCFVWVCVCCSILFLSFFPPHSFSLFSFSSVLSKWEQQKLKRSFIHSKALFLFGIFVNICLYDHQRDRTLPAVFLFSIKMLFLVRHFNNMLWLWFSFCYCYSFVFFNFERFC